MAYNADWKVYLYYDSRIIMSCGCFGASTLQKKAKSSRNPHDIDGKDLTVTNSFSYLIPFNSEY